MYADWHTHAHTVDQEKLCNCAVKTCSFFGGEKVCRSTTAAEQETLQNNHAKGWVRMAGWVQPSSQKLITEIRGRSADFHTSTFFSVESKYWELRSVWIVDQVITKQLTANLWSTLESWNHMWQCHEQAGLKVNCVVLLNVILKTWPRAVWHLNLWTRAASHTFHCASKKGEDFFPAAFLTGLALAE